MRTIWWVAVVVLMAGCGGEDRRGGGGEDAGGVPRDSGGIDAFVATDGGGGEDAGSSEDAGSAEDAGTPTLDAGILDAGPGDACPAGWARCSGVCRNTDTDPGACGMCGMTCPTPGSPIGTSATCVRGTCGYECTTGYGDCDGDASNGCEAHFASDEANCMSCGHACAPGEL